MTPDEFMQYKHNTKKILGYMPIKTPCLTCQTPETDLPKQTRLPNRKCLIRRCVDKTGINNCAFCSRFPCDTLKATAGLWNRKSIETKLGVPLSEKEYHSFVKPFEGVRRLQAIHASLKPDVLVDPFTVRKSEIRLALLHEKQTFKGKLAPFKEIYQLLTTLCTSTFGVRDADTFAQHQTLEKQRYHIFRFLWILGKYGQIVNEQPPHLVVDAETYLAHRGREKTLAMWSFVETKVFKVLADVGVYCKRVALSGVKKEDLTTGTGYLRKKGWIINMAFNDTFDPRSLQVFQRYIQSLNQQYGTRAFRHFQKVDIAFLLEQ
jgi:hypothetical protein